MRKGNNYAFIDSQNVHLGVRDAGWQLDFARFRIYLKEKYCVEKAFLFIGYIAGNERLYTSLQEAGYVCIFKPTLAYKDGATKGNCDAELVLHAMIEYPMYDRAVIVSGDGDFHCLVTHLIEQGKCAGVLVPNKRKYSALLKMRHIMPFVRFVDDLQQKLQIVHRKAPARTKP